MVTLASCLVEVDLVEAAASSDLALASRSLPTYSYERSARLC